mgnify:CR=1 FL=1|jgi:hypothetical protein
MFIYGPYLFIDHRLNFLKVEMTTTLLLNFSRV